MALRNPTQGPRVVPFGVERTASDKLPNGHPSFRVTQRFADTDRFFGGQHNALDLGNYYCNDSLLASVAGTVANKRDIYGALIVEIRESNGNVVGYGHVSRYARSHGSAVSRGTVIASVGDTGLGGVCHCHYYRIEGGRLVDPWPRLEQNIAAPAPTTAYVTFNAGVNGVRMRGGPDARVNNIRFTAWADPTGIRTGTQPSGTWVGNTSAKRTLYSTVRGPDGEVYYRLMLAGTSGSTYVQTRFMYRL